MYVFGAETAELALAAANLWDELQSAAVVREYADEVLQKFVGGLLRARAKARAASEDAGGYHHDILGAMLYFAALWRDVDAANVQAQSSGIVLRAL